MIAADRRARQLRNAGAWGVFFMAIAVFFAGMVMKRNVMRNLVNPLEGINHVLAASQTGDAMRRCTGGHLPPELKHIFRGINDLLDQSRKRSQ